jgi:hypothetical protein
MGRNLASVLIVAAVLIAFCVAERIERLECSPWVASSRTRVESPAVRASRDLVRVAANGEDTAIGRGEAVHQIGFEGSAWKVKRAKADSMFTLPCDGVVLDPEIPPGEFGRVLVQGRVDGVDTSSWGVGTKLCVSPTVAGGLTSSNPSPEGDSTPVAVCVENDPANGSILVCDPQQVRVPDHHAELDAWRTKWVLPCSNVILGGCQECEPLTNSYCHPELFIGCQTNDVTRPVPSISLHFSPTGGCTKAVCDQYALATNSIHVEMYVFSSMPIASALTNAVSRGVKVRVILDKGELLQSLDVADRLKAAGAEVLVDGMHRIYHDKVSIVDGSVVVTGSFNYTHSAEIGNAENVLTVGNDPDLATDYLANWACHAGHSVAY